MASSSIGVGIGEQLLHQCHDKLRQILILLKAYRAESKGALGDSEKDLSSNFESVVVQAESILAFCFRSTTCGTEPLASLCSEILIQFKPYKDLALNHGRPWNSISESLWKQRNRKSLSAYHHFKTHTFDSNFHTDSSVHFVRNSIKKPRALSRNVSRELITPDTSSLSINATRKSIASRSRVSSKEHSRVKITTPVMRERKLFSRQDF